MTIDNVIPALWASRLLVNLNNEHVYASCFNRDYEGEIKQMGSTVKISSIGRITIRSYTRNTDLVSPDTLNDAGQILTIDQGNYFNFQVDDLDKAQENINMMDAAMVEAAWGLADSTDLFLGTQLSSNVATANQLSAATVGRGAGERNAYQVLVDLDVKLTEQNTPRPGRWVVAPPWFEGMIRSDNNFVGFGTGENKPTLTGGKPIGMASGFNIYISNNVPTSSSNPIIVAGYQGAATYAEQVAETVPYKPPLRFSDAMKGLLIYGAKITRPNNLASIVATKGT